MGGDELYHPDNIYGSFGLVIASSILGLGFAYYNYREV